MGSPRLEKLIDGNVCPMNNADTTPIESLAMRVPRLRFTVRRLLLAVACIPISIGLVLWSFHLIGTRYAIGFSEPKFDLIVVGMTTGQVESILGKPLSKFRWYDEQDNRVEYWSYSVSPLGFGYEVRAVCFVAGKVHEKRKEYEDVD